MRILLLSLLAGRHILTDESSSSQRENVCGRNFQAQTYWEFSTVVPLGCFFAHNLLASQNRVVIISPGGVGYEGRLPAYFEYFFSFPFLPPSITRSVFPAEALRL
jgi:hypothetical protein